jgi:hypothetical protein
MGVNILKLNKTNYYDFDFEITFFYIDMQFSTLSLTP